MRRLLKQLIKPHVVVAGLLCGWLLLGPTPNVGAVSLAGISAYPTGKASSAQPWFIYHQAAGSNIQDSITIVNTSAETKQLSLYPVDALLANGSSFAMFPASSPRRDIASWLQLPQNSLKLAPHTSTVVPFRLTIPVSGAVGPHYGGVIVQAQTISQPTTQGGAIVNVVPRLGVRIYETIPGSMHPNLVVSPLQVSRHGSTVAITGSLHNSGNTLLSPSGSITVKNSVGVILLNQAIGLSDVFRPGQTATIHSTLSVPKNLPQAYRVTANVSYGSSLTTASQTSFWVGKSFFVISAGCLLILLVAGSYWLWRRQNHELI